MALSLKSCMRVVPRPSRSKVLYFKKKVRFVEQLCDKIRIVICPEKNWDTMWIYLVLKMIAGTYDVDVFEVVVAHVSFKCR